MKKHEIWILCFDMRSDALIDKWTLPWSDLQDLVIYFQQSPQSPFAGMLPLNETQLNYLRSRYQIDFPKGNYEFDITILSVSD